MDRVTSRDDLGEASTLHDLLQDIRKGRSLFSPVLVSVHPDSLQFEESTAEHTMTSSVDVDWATEYTREYANEEYIILGSNSLQEDLDKPVTIGRSRNCLVRVEVDSVSKNHASIALDRGSGTYFVTDTNSRNGTFINGEKIETCTKTALWPGAYLSFGDAVYVFIDPPTLRKLARLSI